MLILQRKAGESLLIGEDVEISILSVEGGRVRLAIQAPKDVSNMEIRQYRDIKTGSKLLNSLCNL